MVLFLIFAEILALHDWYTIFCKQTEELQLFQKFHKIDLLFKRIDIHFNLIPWRNLTLFFIVFLMISFPSAMFLLQLITESDIFTQIPRVFAYGGLILIKCCHLYFVMTFQFLTAHRFYRLGNYLEKCHELKEPRKIKTKKMFLVADIHYNLCDLVQKTNTVFGTVILNHILAMYLVMVILLFTIFYGQIDRVLEFLFSWLVYTSSFIAVSYSYTSVAYQVILYCFNLVFLIL